MQINCTVPHFNPWGPSPRSFLRHLLLIWKRKASVLPWKPLWEEQTTLLSEPEKMYPGINTGGSRKSRPRPSSPSLLLHRLSLNLDPPLPCAPPNKLPGLPAAILGIISHSCSSVSCTHVQSFQPCPGLKIALCRHLYFHPLSCFLPLDVQVSLATQSSPSCLRAFAPSTPQPGTSLVVKQEFLFCSP